MAIFDETFGEKSDDSRARGDLAGKKQQKRNELVFAQLDQVQEGIDDGEEKYDDVDANDADGQASILNRLL